MNDDKTGNSLHGLLHDASLYYRAPPHLRARVLAGLPRKPRHPPWFAWRKLATHPALTWAGGGLAGVTASALVVGVLAVVSPPRTGMLGDEILSSHVRSLLSQHPVDVVSTDRHTVKPWFNGRLDYAPPVVDLAAQGFPLAGGRVDYVDHRTVAVLIYRYQQHPIDLYVFPAQSGISAPAAYSADGYAMARWYQNGMNYWAVTDAEPVHLNTFVQAVRSSQGK